MKGIYIALISFFVLILVVVGVYLLDQAFVPINDNLTEEIIKNQNLKNTFKIDNTDKSIIVGIYNAGYLYHESHNHGINKDVVTELFNRMNTDFRLEVMPRVRVSSMIEEGLVHVGVSTVETPERANYLYFVPYFTEKNDVLVRSDTNISTEAELLQRENIKVGIVRGYYYGEYYTKLIKKLEAKKMIVQAKDTEQLYKMLDENWIQVTFNLATSYLFYLDYYDIQGINIYDWAPEEEPLVSNLAFSKKYFSPDDIAKVQKTIDEMIDDGTIYKIFNTYISDDNTKRMCKR